MKASFTFHQKLFGIIALMLLSLSFAVYQKHMVMAEAVPNLTPSQNNLVNDDNGVVYYGQTITYEYRLINAGSARASGMDVFSELEPGVTGPTNFKFTNCGGAVINSSSSGVVELSNVFTALTTNCVIKFNVVMSNPYTLNGGVYHNEYYISPAAEGGPEVGPIPADVIVIPFPVCGNGYLEEGNGEQCDDGGTVSNDGCSATCQLEICGDGVLHPWEECDDGNRLDNDGCSTSCVLEFCGDSIKQTNEQCDDGNNVDGDGCNAVCISETCGDGIKQVYEECDDGNNTDNDGCNAACVLEVCGDGIVHPDEECDDGNVTNNDGCSSMCALEVCGDGVKQTNEFCDDGNNISGDGCSATCTLEVCGNTVVETGEECDDGNSSNGDACLNSCQLPQCGDGYLYIGVEQCDDGNNINGDGCSASCVPEDEPFECGNGIVEESEACDDGNVSNMDACLNNCTLPSCGDGYLRLSTEDCDDGNNADGDGCSAICTIEPIECGECDGKVTVLTLLYTGENAVEARMTSSIRPDIVIFEGTVQPNETFTIIGEGTGIDNKDTLGPEVDVQVDGAFHVTIHTSCSLPIGPGSVWGDFTVAEGESRNAGVLCPMDPICGNGLREAGEQCDDGNNAAGDGCSAVCQNENPECPVTPITLDVEVPCWAVDAVNWVIENELFSILDEEDVRDAVKFYRTYQLIMGQ